VLYLEPLADHSKWEYFPKNVIALYFWHCCGNCICISTSHAIMAAHGVSDQNVECMDVQGASVAHA
jgi:hypothetical protein